jgi:hypothetical protein
MKIGAGSLGSDAIGFLASGDARQQTRPPGWVPQKVVLKHLMTHLDRDILVSRNRRRVAVGLGVHSGHLQLKLSVKWIAHFVRRGWYADAPRQASYRKFLQGGRVACRAHYNRGNCIPRRLGRQLAFP